MKNANKLKAALGILAMTGLAAFTPPADAGAAPIAPPAVSTSLGNVLEKANLTLTGQKTQVTGVPSSSSLQKLVGLRKTSQGCDGGGSVNSGGC